MEVSPAYPDWALKDRRSLGDNARLIGDQPIRICLGEPDPLFSALLSDYLWMLGFATVHARVAGEVVRIVRQSEARCVLLSSALGGREISDLVRSISEQIADVPVVVLSSMIDPLDELEMHGAGAAALLEKPFRMSLLHNVLRAVLSSPSRECQFDVH